MKTKTVTFHGAHNYGAVLQAYALQNALISLGYENQIIDYRVDKNNLFEKLDMKINRKNFVNIILNILILFNYSEYKDRFNKFEEFINDCLLLTKPFNSYEELRSCPPEADVYIAGSDQVWNISNKVREAFFLKFGKSDTKRVSYAASMGAYDLNTDKKNLFGKLLSNFEKISVREKEASVFIKDNYNIESQVHLDPVFLLKRDKWKEIAIDYEHNTKYILCYPLLFSPLLNDSLKKLKQMTGYTIIVVTSNPREKIYGDIYIRNAGPKEFLGLIKNAQTVLTTSFHGTAFSIIFEKQFYSFPVFNSTRITNLLELLGLQDRQVSDVHGLSLKDINYEKANIVLEKEVDKSFDFLQRIIEK